ncbi:hypothetical protein GBAR_LOCUS25086 [Geodia barretti]|uniref:Uncharacterized protein n=1 Tax=Geodia barretti TaxID=519541 RepID=A0AA35TD92_GEOBA|nr:hypothetical protein GBAR_LOCUS25086 [Geodia barretti]
MGHLPAGRLSSCTKPGSSLPLHTYCAPLYVQTCPLF